MKKFVQCALFAAAVAVSVGANIGGAILATRSSFSLYLDSVMTFAATALCGLWGGISCAVLSNLALFLLGYTSFPFVLCHILTAAFAHITLRRYKKRNEKTPYTIEIFLWAGVWSAVSNAVSGNIISSILYNSAATPQITYAMQGIYIATGNLTFAKYMAGTLTNLADKIISAVVSFAGYKIARAWN